MSFIINDPYPPVPGVTRNNVSSEERSSAIDFVNWHNLVFEESTHQKMINTSLPDAVVYHTHGTVRGHESMKKFLENTYGYFVPGVSRHATNHVADRDEDEGVIVRYQECLIRYGWHSDDISATNGNDTIRQDGLPAIWWIGRIHDRLRMTADGWKILERHLGTPVRDGRLDLGKAPKL
ncbi:hypothetical protein FHETE_47 [Fusarium heterosporum]|uniref:SnoaL-like domain-containing protein n=1 Tax=Fusarium heterosporum TaxID=42747 RepID=A0A8H5X4N9_FUSHE|nr:hypothetical protein FHETE_47 [Fusarium heterosporum]